LSTATHRELTFADEVDFQPDPNWNDYLKVVTPSTTSYISNWTGNGIGDPGSFPTADDDLTITNNVAVILSGKEFDTATQSSDLTDAASSLTIPAGSSLTINSELDLGDGAENAGVALNNAGGITLNGVLRVADGTTLNPTTIALADHGFAD